MYKEFITRKLWPGSVSETQYGEVTNEEWIRREQKRVQRGTKEPVLVWRGCGQIALYKEVKDERLDNTDEEC